jgi:glycosyltransferase involved in cell wall biosynthesis
MKSKIDIQRPTIGFYCSSIAWGGLEMNTVRYALWMKQSGEAVEVFCVYDSPIYRQAKADGLMTIAVPRNKKYFDFVRAFQLARLMRARHIALVWFRDTRDMDLLCWAKRLFGLRVPFLYQQAMQFGVSKKDPIHTIRFQTIDAWVSTLPYLAHQVRTMTHFDPSKIHVIPLGVPHVDADHNKAEARNFFQLPHEAFVIGLLGRIDPLKGQHDALSALRIMHRAGKKAYLLLVGDSTLHEGNEYREQLLHDIRRFDLENFVILHPHIHETSLFYGSIDCFLMCSKGETFGTVTIEAMAHQVPIIATDSAGSPEILDHGRCGLLYSSGQPEALAQCIIQLQDYPEHTEQMTLQALQRYQVEYSTEISMYRLTQLIVQLIVS